MLSGGTFKVIYDLKAVILVVLSNNILSLSHEIFNQNQQHANLPPHQTSLSSLLLLADDVGWSCQNH